MIDTLYSVKLPVLHACRRPTFEGQKIANSEEERRSAKLNPWPVPLANRQNEPKEPTKGPTRYSLCFSSRTFRLPYFVGKVLGFGCARTALPLNGSFAPFYRPTTPPKEDAKRTAAPRKALGPGFHSTLL